MWKCASFFAGVGGIDLGFEQTGYFETIYANEFDKYPAETMEKNFDLKVDIRDIRDVEPEDLPDFDIMLAGFPCQPFSVAGLRQGLDDQKGRGTLFYELIRIIEKKKPKVVFFENVKNLVGHDNGSTFRTILSLLENQGYKVKYKVLNACEYGDTPQNRERIYIVGFLDRLQFEHFNFPDPIERITTIYDVIDFEEPKDEKYYYREGKYKNGLSEKIIEEVTDTDSVYQWRRKYVRKNQSNVIPTLTANQGMGGHNVCIIKAVDGVRKMTPAECFRAQGFPATFRLPKQADGRLYKQAGNSVCVKVVNRIAEKIVKALY